MNPYKEILEKKYKDFYFDEKKASFFKSKWKEKFFKKNLNEINPQSQSSFLKNLKKPMSLDLEIGIGRGDHLVTRARALNMRLMIGMDLKYKRLAQALRKANLLGVKNLGVIRCNAKKIKEVFSKNELQDIFIHFPDPWEKRRQKKHRLLNQNFIHDLYLLQQKGGEIEMKTDCKEYFENTLSHFLGLPYQIKVKTYDFCHFKKNPESVKKFFPSKESHFSFYETPFEKIFIKQNLPICFAKLVRI